MARYCKALTPAVQAEFVAAIRGGALVAAAARRVGVAVSSLYCRRGRDPLLAAAWEAAARSSGREAVEAAWQAWEAAQPPAPARAGGAGRRRLRFDARRRFEFLRWLELDCDTRHAARRTGVHFSAVYRRIARDPGFAAEVAAALERGYERLAAELAAQRRAEQEAMGDRRRPLEPTGRPTADFDEGMRLLARWERRDGSIGPRFVRRGRLKRWPFEQAIAALDRRLRALGLRTGKP